MNRGLLEHLKDGGNIVIADGFAWEFERRGYLKFGTYIPEIVSEKPDLVRKMHQEFVHAGSDVVKALMYCGHGENHIQKERKRNVEALNRTALKIAHEVALESGKLFAGCICNTGIYDPDNEESVVEVEAFFQEPIQWAIEEDADYIIGESFDYFEEALIALKMIKMYGKGCPAVITLTAYTGNKTKDNVSFPEACMKLSEEGATVVGLNCARGPRTLLPLLKEIRTVYKGPLAAVPVPYRCNDDSKTFQLLRDRETGDLLFPMNVSCMICSRKDIRTFAQEAMEIGINYIGLCCGNTPVFTREIADVYGRSPESSKYMPDLSLTILYGPKESVTYVTRNDKIAEYMIKGKRKGNKIA